MRELKCPHCGSLRIKCTNCDNMEMYEDIILLRYYGYCMKCDTKFSWEENYRLVNICNVIEND